MKNSVLPDTSRTLNEFISSAQPLLKLITHLTDLETSFVTTIDWSTQRQRVLVAENSGVLRVETDSEFHWSNSMCQQMFSKGLTDSNEIDVQFPRSKGAKLGMVSFVVLPIVVDDQTIGTLCAADSASKTLTQQQRDSLGYIADALSLQLKLYIEAENQRHRAVIAQGKVDSLEKQVGNLSELANTDPLTGLLNRRGFEDAYTNATRLVERTAMPLSVLVLDIDDFKDFNDTYGHEMGDDVLKIVAG
ncbi:MAG: diguanylate cyclase, partial [Natronospirillum sp.]